MEQNPEDKNKKRKKRPKAVTDKIVTVRADCCAVRRETYNRFAPEPEKTLDNYVKTNSMATLRNRVELNALLESAQNGNAEKEEELVKRHFLLVMKIARSFKGEYLEIGDLFGAGNLGLVRAIRAYNTKSKVPFSAFASTCITNAMLDYVDSLKEGQEKKKNVDEEESDEADKNVEAVNEGDEISVIKSGKKLSFRESEKLELFLSAISRLGNDDDDIECENGEEADDDPALKAELALLSDQVTKAVDRLGDTSRMIVRLRFGLDGGGERTLVDVATAVGKTTNWTATLLQRALEKLAQSTSLRDFIG